MKSLFARNALLLATLIVLGQLGAALLVRQMVFKPRVERVADGLAATVHALHAGLASMPAEAREPFVQAYNRPAAGREGTAPSRVQRAFVRSLAARVAPDRAEVEALPGGSLGLRLHVEGVSYALLLPGMLPMREFTGAWIAASLAGGALALVGALLIQRRLDRPLRQVVEAARQLSRGATPARLPEDGPVETATLSRSINQLVAALAAADRERALMLAGVSHDLRTPMTKLRLGVEIIHDQLDAELRASMTRSIDEMDAVVGAFLDFARAGEAEAMAVGDLDALARELVRAAADHGRAIGFDAGHPPPVAFQPQALRRAVGNLVENAFRHGEPPVSLATGHADGWAWIEVVDHGVGIAPDQAEAMKQPFRRAGEARSGTTGSKGGIGAGLGLAIADRVARAHGGRLDLLPDQPDRPEGPGLRARLSWPVSA